MKKILSACVIAGAAFAALPAIAQQAAAPQAAPTAQPRKHAMRTFDQKPFDLQTAKNAVDSLLLLREKYKDQKFRGKTPGVAGIIEGMKNSAVHDQILADLKKYGFSSIEDWVGKFMSVGMAISYVQRNKDGMLEKRIAEINKRTDMPETMKQRLTSMLTALIPPKGNAEVARQLLADPAYAEKVKKVIRHRQK